MLTDADFKDKAFFYGLTAGGTWDLNPSLTLRGQAEGFSWGVQAGYLFRAEKANAAGFRFGKVARVLHSWRDHGRRLTRNDPRYAVERFLECKAHHLAGGPLRGVPSVLVWGAGQTGRRLSKHLPRPASPRRPSGFWWTVTVRAASSSPASCWSRWQSC